MILICHVSISEACVFPPCFCSWACARLTPQFASVCQIGAVLTKLWQSRLREIVSPTESIKMTCDNIQLLCITLPVQSVSEVQRTDGDMPRRTRLWVRVNRKKEKIKKKNKKERKKWNRKKSNRTLQAWQIKTKKGVARTDSGASHRSFAKRYLNT